MGFKDFRFLFLKIGPERLCGLFYPISLEATHRIAQTYFCCNLIEIKSKETWKKFWGKNNSVFNCAISFLKRIFF